MDKLNERWHIDERRQLRIEAMERYDKQSRAIASEPVIMLAALAVTYLLFTTITILVGGLW